MTQFAVGDMVPDFTLPASTGEEITLSSFRGRKVVLYFYPKDNTPACTQEACDFRDALPQIEAKGAVVLGISPDELKSHGKFAEKYSLPFPLLSDKDHHVSELYGVWQLKKMYGREFWGVVRSTFLIDEEGRLIKEWRKLRVAGHAGDVVSVL
ncbi:peroxiredoxin [Paenibacillus rhizosphaerae]|uniref:thioredoxin-dependent peroxiredoxin n=1 Tax=Paenibacillus rhizosphaerae TaxID=297318 RepID=A0A1R1EAC8_9BACL|nr:MULTISPECIES: thioredoxin-dependent thiol peroxidase [Paenibacillus]MEC0179646.1 thioredoxin-dependent thiol peroxidase [Paenibacillus favisporus]OMF48767.1 peroxiredoxin [Paenibacillus rhizosphaerae]OXL85970.1 peroxiredoxin [Paenibacillus sp. SSG-1]GIO62222.1 peroxiredoxin [Paenibacillus cineris]